MNESTKPIQDETELKLIAAQNAYLDKCLEQRKNNTEEKDVTILWDLLNTLNGLKPERIKRLIRMVENSIENKSSVIFDIFNDSNP